MKWVYFIKPIGFDGPIKIGNSAAPGQRREQLSVWSPFPLEIAAQISGDHALERRFHARFFDQHVNHEWFTASPELLDTIAAVNAGTFDTDTLPAPRSLSRHPNGRGGPKWTEERKAQLRRDNAFRRAQAASGLTLDWPDQRDIAICEAFIANPCAATGGITQEELGERGKRRVLAHHAEELGLKVVLVA